VNDIALPTEQDARALTDRIKVAVEGTWLLIQEAYTSRAWAALGYDTWDSYCAAEFGTARLRLPREERQEVVASLRESGMSLRAISSATGISPATAMRDSRVSDETPAVILGTDGSTYAAARPTPEPPSDADLLNGREWTQPDGPGFEGAVTPPAAAPKPKRRPLPEALTDAGRDLARAAERLTRLTEDDRFPKNRDTTHHQMPELLGALDHAARFVQAIGLDQAQTSEEARRWWATSLHNTSDALRDVANSLEQEQ
jgi:soluble cytochrome b562